MGRTRGWLPGGLSAPQVSSDRCLGAQSGRAARSAPPPASTPLSRHSAPRSAGCRQHAVLQLFSKGDKEKQKGRRCPS